MEIESIEDLTEPNSLFHEEALRKIARYYGFNFMSSFSVLDIDTTYSKWKIVHDGYRVQRLMRRQLDPKDRSGLRNAPYEEVKEMKNERFCST